MRNTRVIWLIEGDQKVNIDEHKGMGILPILLQQVVCNCLSILLADKRNES